MNLQLDWADYQATKYACTHWHYSGSVPAGKLIKVGVWEDGKYIGVVLYGRGANKALGSPYGLEQTAVCELVRIALTKHCAPVTQMVAQANKMVKKFSPGIRLIVSYAAKEEGHHGGIYQAGNWIYVGPSESHTFVLHGKRVHSKTIHSRWGKGSQSIEWLRKNIDPNAEKITGLIRYKYLMPLDKKMRRQILPLQMPPPRKV